MEFIPNDPILKFNPDALLSIRTETRLTKEEDVNTAVNLLGDWIKKQNHFLKKIFRSLQFQCLLPAMAVDSIQPPVKLYQNKRYDFKVILSLLMEALVSVAREYLERSIIFLKGSVERAKSHTDKLCTYRTLYPNFFNKYDARKDCFAVLNYSFIPVILPKPTENNYRVFLFKMTPENLNSKTFFSAFVLVIMYFEYLKLHDYCNGFVVAVDMRDVNVMDLIKEINLTEVHQIIKITTEGYGFRASGIHFITTSSSIDTLIKLISPMFSAKVGSRFTSQKTIEGLHNVINKDILPIEYGGTERSLNSLYDDWINILSSEAHVNHLKEMNKAGINESLRPVDTNQDNEEIAGTFRNISVD